ncbi:MAG TPA: hypothetical protein VJ725_27780 [Thermoanaerobaculia bacterium]|nr:hypothetical protein [Thermoanaerobaculia bacterium]
MSQSTQVAEPEAKAKAVSYSMLGSRQAKFTFPLSSTSTRREVAAFNPPAGTRVATIALQDFDLKYREKDHYDFGQLQIALTTSNSEAVCTATLRDDNVNKREWHGTVTGIVTFFG